jgi:hypothetical protein
VRAAWPVALLLLLSAAAAVWAALPFRGYGGLAPQDAAVAVRVGAAVAVVLVLAVALVGVLLVALARREARTPVQWFLLAATGFGLLLLLAPLAVAAGAGPLAWLAATAAAATAAWLLRRPGWPAWTAAALAAGGYAGLLAAVAGLAVLAVADAAAALYDAWAVRRRRMGEVAAAAESLGAAGSLQVGDPSRFSLGLGDLILPAAVVGAAADPAGPGLLGALWAALGLALGFLLLAGAVRRWGDLPGTPFLCAGALAGAAAAFAAA